MYDRRRFLSDRQSGATLVESAISAVVIFICIFALLQFAFLVFAYLDARNSASLGSRRGEIAANDPPADAKILETVRKETYLISDDQIERVIVFWAANENSAVPAACLTANNQGVGQGVKGSACNIYTTNEVRTMTYQRMTQNKRDKAWPAESRNVSRSGPPDYLGVTVVVRSKNIGMLNFGRTFTSTTVSRLQAKTG